MTTLALNLKNNAGSQFTNYNYTSFVKVGNLVLGANSQGLFSLDTNNSDNGKPITAFFKPIKTSLNNIRIKTIRSIFVTGEFYGDAKLRISFDDDNRCKKYESVNTLDKEEEQTIKFFGTRFQRGSIFELTFSNINGSDFSVDSITCLISILRNRPVGSSRVAE